MNAQTISRAAQQLRQHWTARTRMAALPADCRPTDRTQAYAVQAEWARQLGQPVVGWKIAATGQAGQAHIGVDGPLAGRLLADRVLSPGAVVPLTGNLMRVAEVEFAFRMASPLPQRSVPYTLDEVMQAVASLHPSVEVPDSRYIDFAQVGAPQLIADDACASWLVLGEASTYDWRGSDLSRHEVSARIGDQVVARGSGAAVLGDPRAALLWIANELRVYGPGLLAGDVVTTGTCIVPAEVSPGDLFVADYGVIGTLEVSFSEPG
jgi:2-keto-4-pentenoate hydratase